MEKSCQPPGDPATATPSTTTTNPNQYLKQLNKLSHKISKPPITASAIRKPPPPPPDQPQPPQLAPPSTAAAAQPPQQHQPPVYNINKNDFRDIVQKLTGSPAHSLSPGPGPGPTSSSTTNSPASTPPILGGSSPKPPSSRLHRIRPPPLAHVTNRPPPNLLNCAAPNLQPQPPFFNPPLVNHNPIGGFVAPRPTSAAAPPLSPLPPLPAVHTAAESPVSAYMRYFRSSSAGAAASTFPESGRQFSPLAPLVSPRWNNLAAPPRQPPAPPAADQPPPAAPPQGGSYPQLPTSPLPFGCMSPRSTAASYPPLLSPGLLLSPTAFPLSPTVPVLSPKWRGL